MNSPKSSTLRAAIALAILAPLATPASAQTYEDLKLLAPDGDHGDFFGHSVAISGDKALIGAFGDDETTGAAYVFDLTTGQQVAKLFAEDGDSEDYFGYSVAISGDTALIGAHRQDDSTGAAYVFDLTTGLQTAKFFVPDGEPGDYFGYSVAISGDTALIGASQPNQYPGAAYVFDLTTGQQVAKLLASDGEDSDDFGSSVAISGTTAIVGADRDIDANGFTTGSAYVFDLTTGQETAKLLASDGEDFDYFGHSVAISGDTALIGAYLEGDTQTGAAYVFDVTTGLQTAKFFVPDGEPGDYFGYSVAISGDTALIGASQPNQYPGAAYAFSLTTGQQVAKLLASDGEAYDDFGLSVAISGGTALIGAYLKGGAIGAAYVYKLHPWPGALETLATLDLFASDEADVRYSHVDGVITAGDRIKLVHFSCAVRPSLTSESDVLISGGRLIGQDGAVFRGNAVYGSKDKLKDSVTFLDSSQDPRFDSPLDFDLLANTADAISTDLGMLPANGTTLEEFGNLILHGAEPGLNVFLVTRKQMQKAHSVTVTVPHGASSVINVEGGKVKASVVGIDLNGATPEDVLFNFFEAHKVGFSQINLEAGVLSPFAKLTVTDIDVYGGLIAERLELRNVSTFGRLFDLASLVNTDEDEYLSGEDGSDTPGYTLTWTPDNKDQLVHLVHYSPEVMEIWVEGPNGANPTFVRQVRLDRLERLVFTDRSDLSKIQIDPEITLPVELTGLAPVAQDDHAALEWGGSATADVLANDLVGPAALDPSSVQVLTATRFGTVTVDPATGAVTYDCISGMHRPAGLDGEVLEYTVQDVSGNVSTPRRVRFSFEASDSGELGNR